MVQRGIFNVSSSNFNGNIRATVRNRNLRVSDKNLKQLSGTMSRKFISEGEPPLFRCILSLLRSGRYHPRKEGLLCSKTYRNEEEAGRGNKRHRTILFWMACHF